MAPGDSGTSVAVRTVLGDIDPAELGITLMHEHPIHRLSIHSGKDDNTWVDVDLVAQELVRFREAGGGTVCDVTPVNVGRDPAALMEASRRSGVHIVSAVGLYQLEVWSDEMLAMSRGELADYIVREAEGGATGVPAGFLGEIASHNEIDQADWRAYRLWDKEEEIFRSSHRRTTPHGSVHFHPCPFGRNGVAQLRVIAAAGGDTSRVIIGHCDDMAHDDPALDFDYYDQILGFGAMLEFELFGWQDVFFDDNVRIARLAELVKRGHADSVLLATDTCRLSQLHANGGRGFDFLLTWILPALREAGVGEPDIRKMTVTNPTRVLSVQSAHSLGPLIAAPSIPY